MLEEIRDTASEQSEQSGASDASVKDARITGRPSSSKQLATARQLIGRVLVVQEAVPLIALVVVVLFIGLNEPKFFEPGDHRQRA